jgi:hypothetical protein
MAKQAAGSTASHPDEQYDSACAFMEGQNGQELPRLPELVMDCRVQYRVPI